MSNYVNIVKVNVILTVGNNTGSIYSYYLPFVANNANGFTSQVRVQNVGSGAATLSAQYYDSAGNNIAIQSLSCSNIGANAACNFSNPFANGSKGTGVIVSNQPLSVLVSESTPYGSSAYAVQAGSYSSLVAPLAINNNGGFVTQLTVANVSSSATQATVTFYDQDGNLLPDSTKTLNLAVHSSQNLDQSAADSHLPPGFYGWAQIIGTAGAQLVAQVLEQRSDIKFVALANSQQLTVNNQPPNTVYKLFASAIFRGAFGGFVTGANLVNPNLSPVKVTITYYDNQGQAYPTAPFVLAAHAVAAIYQGANSGNGIPNGGLPVGFYGSAMVSSSGGKVVMVVNEAAPARGYPQTTSGAAQSGTYAAATSDNSSNKLGLPFVANQGQGFSTGATIFNTSEASVSGTISYYQTDGTQVATGNAAGQSNTITISAHASQPVYQGRAGLPSGFYGQAVITQTGGTTGSLMVTTNVQGDDLFYTYTQPN